MKEETEHSRPEEPFEIDWSHQAGEGTPSVTLDSFAARRSPSAELPVEPAAPPEPAGDRRGDLERAAALTELMEFHRYGRREPHAVPDARAGRPRPALLHAYRDLATVRHDYPVCLTGRDASIRTLTAIVDDVVAKAAGDGELGERRKRHLMQLDVEIRRLCEKGAGRKLSGAWDEATRRVLDAAPSDEKRDLIRESLSAARSQLDSDGELLPCALDTPRRLFTAVAAASWDARCARWREQLDALVLRTQNILAADDSHSADLSSPEHLRDAAAGEDMDFEAMSKLLKESRLGEPLPEERRDRIQRALDAILKVKPLFDGTISLFDASARLPFDLQPVRNACAAAFDRNHARLRAMVGFFRSLRIAELETENRYLERVHDRFFAQFDAHHLTAQELSLCPPIVLVLDDGFFADPDVSGLFDLLGSGIPVKVFVEMSDLGACAEPHPAATPGWPARLAGMAVAMNNVHVMQASASVPTLLRAGFADAFDYDGASLVCVYTGSEETHPGLPLYLTAASATESRFLPVFTFDPGRGETLTERMRIAGNPHPERMWTSGAFAYQGADGEEREVELEFTPADFVFQDVRFDDHFWRVEPSKWHEKMTPLGEYLRRAPEETETSVPYVTAVDPDGAVARVVVTRDVVGMVRRVGASWRNTQESGGVENSFALDLLEREGRRLAEEKQREIEEIEKRYSSNLDRDVAALTQEIVQRIAAQLLAGAAGPPTAFGVPARAPMAPPPPKPAPPDAPQAVPAERVEEEEEALPIGDPYIDTPLCTSCNECTKINAQLFAYDGNKQAFIKNADAGTFRDLVMAAEKCPVKIIHPGQPRNPSESGLDDLVKRAAAFN